MTQVSLFWMEDSEKSNSNSCTGKLEEALSLHTSGTRTLKPHKLQEVLTATLPHIQIQQCMCICISNISKKWWGKFCPQRITAAFQLSPRCYILLCPSSELLVWRMKPEPQPGVAMASFEGWLVRNQLTQTSIYDEWTLYIHFRIFSTCKYAAVPYTERIPLDVSLLFPIITCHVFLISHNIYYLALLNREFLLLQSVWVVWSTSCSVSVPPLISTLEMIAGSYSKEPGHSISK